MSNKLNDYVDTYDDSAFVTYRITILNDDLECQILPEIDDELVAKVTASRLSRFLKERVILEIIEELEGKLIYREVEYEEE